jgi:hypothetical protein
VNPYLRSPYVPSLPPWPPLKNRFKVVALVALSVAVLALVAVVAGYHHAGSITSGGGSTGGTAVIPPPNQDKWYAAVCRIGTFHPGTGPLPHADLGRETCVSNSGAGPIYSGSYSSAYMARNDAAIYRRGYSASVVAESGAIVLFVAPNDRTGTALQPLVHFGFTVKQSGS